MVLGTGCTVGRSASAAPAAPPAPDPLAFTLIQPGLDDDVIVAQGYGYAALLKWGQPILAGAPNPEIMFPDWNEAASTRVQADVERPRTAGRLWS